MVNYNRLILLVKESVKKNNNRNKPQTISKLNDILIGLLYFLSIIEYIL